MNWVVLKLVDSKKGKKSTGLRTKKEVVEEGLKALIQIKNQSKLKSLRGQLKWEGDINKMRADKWYS